MDGASTQIITDVMVKRTWIIIGRIVRHSVLAALVLLTLALNAMWLRSHWRADYLTVQTDRNKTFSLGLGWEHRTPAIAVVSECGWFAVFYGHVPKFDKEDMPWSAVTEKDGKFLVDARDRQNHPLHWEARENADGTLVVATDFEFNDEGKLVHLVPTPSFQSLSGVVNRSDSEDARRTDGPAIFPLWLDDLDGGRYVDPVGAWIGRWLEVYEVTQEGLQEIPRPPPFYRGLAVGYPILSLPPTGILGMILWCRWHRWRRHRRASREKLCNFCGYDLRAHGVGDRCPECGRPVQQFLSQPLSTTQPATATLEPHN